ncbi:MAG: hypothetical protein Q9214_004476, partial [Letrouitia sp. 1 TL-2023]
EITAEPDSISPNLNQNLNESESSSSPLSPRQHRTSISSKRLSGRLPINASTASLHSTASLDSLRSFPKLDPVPSTQGSSSHHSHHHRSNQLISQITEWLQNEKARRANRRLMKDIGHSKVANATDAGKSLVDKVHSGVSLQHKRHRRRHFSEPSEGALALQKLEQILENATILYDEVSPVEDRKGSIYRKRSGKTLYRRKSTVHSSDTECQDYDILVPSVEAVLDNSQTLKFAREASESTTSFTNPDKRSRKEEDAWTQFKNEIVRLAHTLKLKGWRRIGLDQGAHIGVERLSGALTNSVYVVSPPQDLEGNSSTVADSTVSIPSRNPPQLVGELSSDLFTYADQHRKLLLRIYGPQVEHLIDRQNELQILRRLARKKIGPRLLGTFTNGRFEQFFNARTLTAKDLRIPETSKQIAKRMRELHDGIELLDEERDAGPFIWQNWDNWVERCEQVITWLDSRLSCRKSKLQYPTLDNWRNRGLVCGVEWPQFRQTVERYRKWLEQQCGGSARIRRKLVFAHNDTQYGNLLRLKPDGESPLLHPANEHKQLIVIDFEYSNANVRGLEFANHFTEWCYNYHDSFKPYALNAKRYPTPEEQHRFLKAYVQHQPFRPPLSTTPSANSISQGRTNSVSSFMLDRRAPPAQIDEEEAQRDQAIEDEIQRLSHETRLWRVANSAQWVAWGTVQAKLPEMEAELKAQRAKENGKSASDLSSTKKVEEATREAEEDEEEEAFDYLGYAQERAMFFWGDVLQMGIVREDELPRELLKKIKVVEY